MNSPQILIIGAGMSGICLAIQLQRAGIESFTILEKSSDIGGTWHDNTYPGAACDIPSFLYSFSFAPKYDWQRKYAKQPEILAYFRDCAERSGILRHVKFGTTVVRAEFDEEQAVWHVHTDDGQVITAEVLVSAVGQLGRPQIPELKGLDSFAGTRFHSARWNHDCDLDGRDVAVIGNAASAVQFLPHVAARARQTYVFQRSPNWICRLHDYPYSRFAHWALRNLPGVARLHRWGFLLGHDWRIVLLEKASFQNRWMTLWVRRGMRKQVPPELRSKLIPDYPAACKRILLSNDFLKLVQRDNVELVTSPISHLVSDAVVAADGPRPVQVVIFATGFDTSRFLVPMEVRGRNGLSLHDAWTPRPKTYLGLMSPRFPNFFTLYGPNTNLAHNSIIFMVECQVNFIVRLLQKMMLAGGRTVEVRGEVVERFDRQLQKKLDKSVWSEDCSNWYKSADGSITNNWSSSVIAYWLRTRSPDIADFRVVSLK